jgi:hypothetical protein
LSLARLLVTRVLRTLVSPRQRRSVNIEFFRDFAVREIIFWFSRFDIFNRFLNWVYGGGVMTR